MESESLASLEVLEKFGEVLAQGPAIFGRRRFGVPPGGYFDSESATLANALIGLDASETVIELSLASIKLRAISEVSISIVGPELEVMVDGQPLWTPARIHLPPEASIEIPVPREGTRVYVAGGFTNVKPQTQIVERQTLELKNRRGGGIRLAERPRSLVSTLRLLPGAHERLFEPGRLFEASHRVSGQSNRVGIRLERLFEAHNLEFPSEPAGLGAVQVTRDGTPILIGPDGPTIGGYPKVAHVISADWDRMGQLRPGDQVRFEPVSLNQARAAAADRRQDLNHRVAQLLIHR